MPKRIAGEAPGGFGARLAQLRKQAGLTQTALAREVGISQRMMAYYEGPTAFPPATERNAPVTLAFPSVAEANAAVTAAYRNDTKQLQIDMLTVTRGDRKDACEDRLLH